MTKANDPDVQQFEKDLLQSIGEMKRGEHAVVHTPASLEIWVVYDHPLDEPGMFVARKWVLDQPTGITMAATTLDGLREMLPEGLYMMPRQEGDDPVIVETWF